MLTRFYSNWLNRALIIFRARGNVEDAKLSSFKSHMEAAQLSSPDEAEKSMQKLRIFDVYVMQFHLILFQNRISVCTLPEFHARIHNSGCGASTISIKNCKTDFISYWFLENRMVCILGYCCKRPN